MDPLQPALPPSDRLQKTHAKHILADRNLSSSATALAKDYAPKGTVRDVTPPDFGTLKGQRCEDIARLGVRVTVGQKYLRQLEQEAEEGRRLGAFFGPRELQRGGDGGLGIQDYRTARSYARDDGRPRDDRDGRPHDESDDGHHSQLVDDGCYSPTTRSDKKLIPEMTSSPAQPRLYYSKIDGSQRHIIQMNHPLRREVANIRKRRGILERQSNEVFARSPVQAMQIKWYRREAYEKEMKELCTEEFELLESIERIEEGEDYREVNLTHQMLRTYEQYNMDMKSSRLMPPPALNSTVFPSIERDDREVGECNQQVSTRAAMSTKVPAASCKATSPSQSIPRHSTFDRRTMTSTRISKTFTIPRLGVTGPLEDVGQLETLKAHQMEVIDLTQEDNETQSIHPIQQQVNLQSLASGHNHSHMPLINSKQQMGDQQLLASSHGRAHLIKSESQQQAPFSFVQPEPASGMGLIPASVEQNLSCKGNFATAHLSANDVGNHNEQPSKRRKLATGYEGFKTHNNGT